ncbi:MAG: hypothetical protein H0W20_11575 [Chthoniobacterales bacterium]|nr:hypothetical protein [Chthoniobacterales bacterium]
MKILPHLILLAATLLSVSCATVDVTKTAKGYHAPTNPNNVEILMTVPTRPFIELGTVTVTNVPVRNEAKMHNAIRAKAAPLGANAVVIQSQGIIPALGGGTRWATGAALRYQ